MNTYKKANGMTLSTDQEAIPVADWIAEGEKLFGKGIMGFRFRCPMCGKTWSVDEFRQAGGKLDSSYQECIGRYHGAGAPGSSDGNPDGCNWAAYGLFGVPNGQGRLVLARDGKVVEVFDYAREEV